MSSLKTVPGRIVGVAGESGSGKTTAVLAAIGYQPASAVRLGGDAHLGDAADLRASARRSGVDSGRNRISYVAQDAAGALNPAFRIGTQLREVLEVNLGLSPRAVTAARPGNCWRPCGCPIRTRCCGATRTSVPGGQLQRIAIAMAIACDPELIVCDEPTTGLDVTTQAEVVQMLMELIRSRRMAAIYISHDLGAARRRGR